MRRLIAEGVSVFVEVGPGTVLSGLARKAARDATVLNVAEPSDLAAVEAVR
jgi:[acyl-carrier-protein] S-malonyltransferase